MMSLISSSISKVVNAFQARHLFKTLYSPPCISPIVSNIFCMSRAPSCDRCFQLMRVELKTVSLQAGVLYMEYVFVRSSKEYET